jgi:hypothetical protein
MIIGNGGNTMAIRKTKPNYRSPLRDLATQLHDVAVNHLCYSQVVELMHVLDSHLNALAYIEEVHRNADHDP